MVIAFDLPIEIGSAPQCVDVARKEARPDSIFGIFDPIFGNVDRQIVPVCPAKRLPESIRFVGDESSRTYVRTFWKSACFQNLSRLPQIDLDTLASVVIKPEEILRIFDFRN